MCGSGLAIRVIVRLVREGCMVRVGISVWIRVGDESQVAVGVGLGLG